MKGLESLVTSKQQPPEAPIRGRKDLVKRLSKYVRKEILIVIGIIMAMRYLVRAEFFGLEQVRGFLGHVGIIAPIAFIVICALTIPAFVPPLLLIGVGSMVFGKTTGALYSLFGITVGACLAFLFGRYSATNFVERFKKGRFKRIDEWMMKCNEFVCMISLRLIFFSHPMINYASSATRITLRDYALGTFVGLIPRTFMLSYFFELFMKITSLHDVLTNPFVLSFPMLRIIGVLLLIALTKGAGREVV